MYKPLISPKERSFVVIVACFVERSLCIAASVVVTFAAKLAELSRASANSFNVSSAVGTSSPIKSLPCIKIALTSITLKLASFADKSPCTFKLLRDISVVWSIFVDVFSEGVNNIPLW